MMLKKTRIKTKILLSFMLIGILSVCITGWIVYENAKNSLEETHFNQLTAIRETKRRQIETYFKQIRNQITTFSEDQMIINAMYQFKKVFFEFEMNDAIVSKIEKYTNSVEEYYQDEFLPRLNANIETKKTIEQFWPTVEQFISEDESDPYYHATVLQYLYISNNPHPTGSKDNLDFADDGSEYSLVHSKYHPIIRNYLKSFGFYDIFLIDEETGHIVYSVFKEVDFATSLQAGPYKDTNFANAYKEALNANDKDFVKLVDFAPYGPSYAAPASFIASPIFDGDKKIGVLVFQVPINEINRVMTGDFNWKDEGLGDSGETYIVGSDYKMRNDSRFIIEEPDRYLELLAKIGVSMKVIDLIKSYSTSILFQDVQTEAVEDALKGNKGTKIIKDYRGISVLSSYVPLNIKDVQWVMLSEIDEKEAFLTVNKLRNRILIIIIIVTILVIFTGLVLTITISKAEDQMESSLKEKEVLLKEIHHRVKNNMQVISSLLNMQTRQIKDKKLLNMFRECQNQIRSMSQIHEELYKTEDLAKIEFAVYIRKLAGSLMRSYAIGPDRILLDINVDSVFLGVDVAIPCGLIINELFSNSLKYAFPAIHNVIESKLEDGTKREQGKDKIYINFNSDNNKYTLIYGDNGVGLPYNIKIKDSNTLGLELINTLTQQIRGSIKVDRSKGTEFKITFKV